MKMFNLKKKSKSKGFTLIEILLVVGFIALAGIGVYVVYNKVQTSNAANTEVRNLDTIRAGVKNIYAGSTNYSTVSNTVLNNAKVAPDNMRGTAVTSLVSSFGGAVDVTPVTLGTANGFAITYTGVPSDICAKFITVGGNSFNRVTVGAAADGTGGTAVKDTTAATPINSINVSDVAGACANGNVTVSFASL